MLYVPSNRIQRDHFTWKTVRITNPVNLYITSYHVSKLIFFAKFLTKKIIQMLYMGFICRDESKSSMFPYI